MRGAVAKEIRRYVRFAYPFLSEESLYIRLPNGQMKLAEQCRKHHVQRLKRQFMRSV